MPGFLTPATKLPVLLLLVAMLLISGCATVSMTKPNPDINQKIMAHDFQGFRQAALQKLNRIWGLQERKQGIQVGEMNDEGFFDGVYELTRLATAEIQLGNFASARRFIDIAMPILMQIEQEIVKKSGQPIPVFYTVLMGLQHKNAILKHIEGESSAQSLAEFDKMPPGLDAQGRAWGRLNYASYLTFAQGDYTKAIGIYEDALASLDQLGLKDFDQQMAGELQAFIGLIWAYINTGRLDEAETLLARYDDYRQNIVFQVGSKTVGNLRFFRYYFADLEFSAGALSALMRDYDRAWRYFEMAKARFDLIGDDDWDPADRQALGRYEILLGAYYYGTQGQHQQALKHIQRGIQLIPDHYMESLLGFGKQTGMIYAAELELQQGNERGAMHYANQARQFALKLNDRVTQARAALIMGDLYRGVGKPRIAREQYQTAIRLTQGKSNTELWRAYHGLGLLEEQRGAVSEAIRLYQAAVVEVEKLWHGSFKDAAKQLSFLGSRLKVYGPLIRSLIDQGNDREAVAYMEKSKARTLLQSGAFVKGLRGGTARSIDVETMQRLLATDQGMLVYHIGKDNVSAAYLDRHTVDARNLGISPQALAREIEAFKTQVTGRSNWDARRARSLHGLLVRPFEAALARTTSLIILPHGALHYLPFQALSTGPGDPRWQRLVLTQGAMRGVEPRGLARIGYRSEGVELHTDERYLAQRHQLAYSPNATLLNQLIRRPKGRITSGSRLLAIGSPPQRTVDLGRGQKESLSKLPHAAAEIREVSQIFPHGETLVGRDATETAFKRRAGSNQIILLSTHAFTNPVAPGKSSVVLSRDRGNDGLLSVDEIRQMRLDADLVALSACETGVVARMGGVGNQGDEPLPLGDDLSSLHRAFLQSGTDSVLSTLWAVHDESTKVFTVNYFAALAKGHSRMKAMSLAQGQLMQDPKWAHPRYWAPFTLTGRWD